MSAIELRNITKCFGETQVVYPVDLQVAHGELVTLLGPSGSGKSTILSMIAGLLEPTEGRIFINGRDVTHVTPAKRNLGMVFQSYAIFPHMTVFDNVAFALSIRKVDKTTIRERVMRTLDMVQLGELARRRPNQLSGGQQQRVALARALVFEPDILLLDEPMGALDKNLRQQLQLELRQLQRELGVTTIMVTHDQEEALSLSTRLVVLDGGTIQQVAPPEEAYRRPANRFVAEFIGTANLWRGEVRPNGATNAEFMLPDGQVLACHPESRQRGPAWLLIRPEDLQVHDTIRENQPAATLNEAVYMGQHTRLHLETADGISLVAITESARSFTPGQSVSLDWKPEKSWIISD